MPLSKRLKCKPPQYGVRFNKTSDSVIDSLEFSQDAVEDGMLFSPALGNLMSPPVLLTLGCIGGDASEHGEQCVGLMISIKAFRGLASFLGDQHSTHRIKCSMKVFDGAGQPQDAQFD